MESRPVRRRTTVQRIRGAGWIPFLLLLLGAAATAEENPPTAADDAVLRPDFSDIGDIQARKLQFFTYLLPVVQAENEQVERTRLRRDYLHDRVRFRREMAPEDELWLVGLAEEYDVEVETVHDPEFWHTLLRRVDTVPSELVLVQAALESAWGTSRFAQQGNNYFGQWCFLPGCGIVPASRSAGAAHEVERFGSVAESVAGYLRNLNTGEAYRHLREIREDLRRQGLTPDAATLADGLHPYSERGETYVRDIRSMLRQNEEVIRAARDQLLVQTAGG